MEEPLRVISVTLDFSLTELKTLRKVVSKLDDPDDNELVQRILALVESRASIYVANEVMQGSNSGKYIQSLSCGCACLNPSRVSQWTYQEGVLFVTKPHMIRIPQTMLLSSRIGNFLEKRAWLPMATLISLLIYLATYLYPNTEVSGIVLRDGKEIGISDMRLPLAISVSRILLIIVANVLLAHRVNRHIFCHVMRRSERIMLFLCMFLSGFVLVYHRAAVLGPLGIYDTINLCDDLVYYVAHIPGYLFIAGADSVQYPRKIKLCIAAVPFALFTYLWYVNLCVSKVWGKDINCGMSLVGNEFEGITRRKLYIFCVSQGAVFCFKSSSPYFFRDFADFHPEYLTMSVRETFRASQISKELESTDSMMYRRGDLDSSPSPDTVSVCTLSASARYSEDAASMACGHGRTMPSIDPCINANECYKTYEEHSIGSIRVHVSLIKRISL